MKNILYIPQQTFYIIMSRPGIICCKGLVILYSFQYVKPKNRSKKRQKPDDPDTEAPRFRTTFHPLLKRFRSHPVDVSYSLKNTSGVDSKKNIKPVSAYIILISLKTKQVLFLRGRYYSYITTPSFPPTSRSTKYCSNRWINSPSIFCISFLSRLIIR